MRVENAVLWMCDQQRGMCTTLEDTQQHTNLVLAQHGGVCAIAQREALHLLQRHTLLCNLAQRVAAIQHRFVKVPPRALPWAPWINGEAVEHHGKAGQATKCWFVLRAKLLNELEETLHGAVGQRLGKELLAYGKEGCGIAMVVKTTQHLHQRKTARLGVWAARVGKRYGGSFGASVAGRPAQAAASWLLDCLDLVVAGELGCSAGGTLSRG